MSNDFLKEHIVDIECPKCESNDIQLASMGHPMPLPVVENGALVLDEMGHVKFVWSDADDNRDIWWGGDIVSPGMKTDFNRRCRGCHNLFKV